MSLSRMNMCYYVLVILSLHREIPHLYEQSYTVNSNVGVFFNATDAFAAIFKAECTGCSKKLESIILNEACEFIGFM